MSPSATTIETIAISSGMSPATTAPKTSSRMISAAGQPELELALLEILLREQVEVVVERRVAGDRDVEGGALARRLDALDDPGRVGVVEIATGRASRAGRRRRRLARLGEVGASASSAPARRCLRASVPTNASNSGASTVYCSERTITTSVRTRPDPAERRGRARRPRAPTRGCSSARPRWSGCRRGGSAIAAIARTNGDPRSDRPPRMPGAGRGDGLGRELHGHRLRSSFDDLRGLELRDEVAVVLGRGLGVRTPLARDQQRDERSGRRPTRADPERGTMPSVNVSGDS